MSEIQIVELFQVINQLPEECYLRTQFEEGDLLGDSKILYFKGDLNLEQLNLDAPLGVGVENRREDYRKFLEEKSLSALFVDGDLQVKESIYNENTDGTLDLIISGNLAAKNMVVGGSEIYVCGSLSVGELFWGDYNHGSLVVLEDFHTKVLIETDEYHLNLECESFFKVKIIDFDTIEDEKGISEPLIVDDLEAIFSATVLTPSDGYGTLVEIDREAVLQKLVKGESVLNPEGLAQLLSKPQIPRIFQDDLITVENIMRLGQSPLLVGREKFEFFIEDLRIVIKPATGMDEKGVDWGPEITLWQDETYGFFISTRKQTLPKKKSLFGAKKNNDGECEIYVAYSNDKAEDKGWYIFHEETSPEVFTKLLEFFWPKILRRIESLEAITPDVITNIKNKFDEAVRAEKIKAYLQLPIVLETYNDYKDTDKNGYWNGNCYFAFRRLGLEDSPRIQVVVERAEETLPYFPTVKEEIDIHGYYYEINRETNAVELRYVAHNGVDAGSRPVGNEEVLHLKNALRYWKYFETRIGEDNEAYLQEKKRAEEALGALKNKYDTKPNYNRIQYQGINFTVITPAYGHELLHNLKDLEGKALYDVFQDSWRFPSYEENQVFLLADEDVELDNFSLDYGLDEYPELFIFGFIFMKNVKIKNLLMTSDLDNSPVLCVIGNLEAKFIWLAGNVHYVLGDIKTSILWGQYNHGFLCCNGKITADLLLSDDMQMQFRGFESMWAIVNLKRADIQVLHQLSDEGKTVFVLNYLPSNRRLDQVLQEEWVERDADNPERLSIKEDDTHNPFELFKKGQTVLDFSKKDAEKPFVSDLAARFARVFSHPQVNNQESYAIPLKYEEQFFFGRFEFEGKHYQEVGFSKELGYNYRLRVLHIEEDNDYQLLLEYFKDSEMKDYKAFFATQPADEYVESDVVKHAFNEAERKLFKGETP